MGISDEVREQQARELAAAQHQRQAHAALLQQTCQFLDTLAPEMISACNDLGYRMNRAKRRLGSVACWVFYLQHPRSDGYSAMHVGFVPAGGWELLGKRTLNAYGGPHDDRFWIVPRDPGLLDGGTIKHGIILAYVELSMSLDEIRAQLVDQLRRATRR
ncbi:hypothetical protein [Nocardia fluminea]|uniref:hypothetical protein n=1 Tax=Nocardia fluminea TaxID=134984 RepID=UPI003D0B52FC